MLPPKPEATLATNPHFAVLYNYLTTHIFLADGSTRSKADEDEAVRKALNRRREAAIHDAIMLKALEEIAQANQNRERTNTNGEDLSVLPSELQGVVMSVANYLAVLLDPTTNVEALPEDTDELMAEEVQLFKQHLPEISAALSRHLTKTESSLYERAQALLHTSISEPSDPDKGSSLAAIIEEARKSIEDQRNHALPEALQAVQSALAAHQTQHIADLHNHIHRLELHTHGTQSRYLTARSSYLAASAQSIAHQARILKLEQDRVVLGDEDMPARLEQELRAVEVEESELDRKIEESETLLHEYDQVAG